MNNFRFLNAPGIGIVNSSMASQMLHFGQQIRDELIWRYPILPGAVVTYIDMASGREWKISGPEIGVPRAIEWMNEAQVRTHDGIIEYGLEPFLRRRALDHLSIGRTLFTWGEGKPLRYLDPYEMSFQLENMNWYYGYSGEYIPQNYVTVNHPIPIGMSGSFISPLYFVIPSAMLSWLIREHDTAAADGRKVRDIILVLSEELAEQITKGIDQSVKLWSGANPAEIGANVIYAETQLNMPASDLVTRIGLANIPEGFDRNGFEFAYVNEISAALGIALRHFWNSEKATNRALEEVQESRQQFKGPSSFVRSEQRLYNRSGMLKQFGRRIRHSFIEEVDTQNRKVNAEVLELTSRALGVFAEVFGGNVNGDAFLAWLQQLEVLPADLDLITDMGTVNPDQDPVNEEGEVTQNSDANTVRDGKKKKSIKSKPAKASEEKTLADELGYDEISMNSDGQIIERRSRVFTVEKAIALKHADRIVEEMRVEKPDFQAALKKGREALVEKFAAIVEKHLEDEEVQYLNSKQGEFSDDDYRRIQLFLSRTHKHSTTL